MTPRWYLVLPILMLMSAAMAADIGMSPPRLDVTVPLGATVTETTSLFSTGDKPQSLDVALGDWIQTESGSLSYLKAGEDPYSASSWITLSSDVVAVPAGGSLDYRFSITAPNDPSLQGTYKSVIFFATQAARDMAHGNAFLTRQRIGLIVYVTIAGTAKPSVQISDFYRQGKNLLLTMSNSGNVVSRLGGKVELRDQAGSTVDSLAIPDVPVQRDGIRTVQLELPTNLDPGFYVALALVKPDNASLQAGQLQLQLP